MNNKIELGYDLMGEKVHIVTTDGKEIKCIVDEFVEGANSDRYPIPYAFIKTMNNQHSFIYADEIESIELLE